MSGSVREDIPTLFLWEGMGVMGLMRLIGLMGVMGLIGLIVVVVAYSGFWFL